MRSLIKTPGDQPGDGGENPARTLHSNIIFERRINMHLDDLYICEANDVYDRIMRRRMRRAKRLTRQREEGRVESDAAAPDRKDEDTLFVSPLGSKATKAQNEAYKKKVIPIIMKSVSGSMAGYHRNLKLAYSEIQNTGKLSADTAQAVWSHFKILNKKIGDRTISGVLDWMLNDVDVSKSYNIIKHTLSKLVNSGGTTQDLSLIESRFANIMGSIQQLAAQFGLSMVRLESKAIMLMVIESVIRKYGATVLLDV